MDRPWDSSFGSTQAPLRRSPRRHSTASFSTRKDKYGDEHVRVGKHRFPIFSHPFFRKQIEQDSEVVRVVEQELRSNTLLDDLLEELVESLLQQGKDGVSVQDVESILQERIKQFDGFLPSLPSPSAPVPPPPPLVPAMTPLSAAPTTHRRSSRMTSFSNVPEGPLARNSSEGVPLQLTSSGSGVKSVVEVARYSPNSMEMQHSRVTPPLRPSIAIGHTASGASIGGVAHIDVRASSLVSQPFFSSSITSTNSAFHHHSSSAFQQQQQQQQHQVPPLHIEDIRLPSLGRGYSSAFIPTTRSNPWPVSPSCGTSTSAISFVRDDGMQPTGFALTQLTMDGTLRSNRQARRGRRRGGGSNSRQKPADVGTGTWTAMQMDRESSLEAWRRSLRTVVYSLLHARLELAEQGGVDVAEIRNERGPQVVHAVDAEMLESCPEKVFRSLDVEMDGNSCVIRARSKNPTNTTKPLLPTQISRQMMMDRKQKQGPQRAQPSSTLAAAAYDAVHHPWTSRSVQDCFASFDPFIHSPTLTQHRAWEVNTLRSSRAVSPQSMMNVSNPPRTPASSIYAAHTMGSWFARNPLYSIAKETVGNQTV